MEKHASNVRKQAQGKPAALKSVEKRDADPRFREI
jgi:hypothetical protein